MTLLKIGEKRDHIHSGDIRIIYCLRAAAVEIFEKM